MPPTSRFVRESGHLRISKTCVSRRSSQSSLFTLNKYDGRRYRQIFWCSTSWWTFCISVSHTSHAYYQYSHSTVPHRFSGFVVVQVVVYFKLYLQDPRPLKILVHYLHLFIHSFFLNTVRGCAGLDCVV